ncbi:MAG TPA: HAMP domain-containing sensor histidine kinase [Kofleriaceae bacterium]|nr:HAMP domain-containing sensor histidine kinase [Kofleriaceae bacterium]
MRRLTERLQAAEEALRQRDRSLAIVSHDLKNPLNVIELNCQLLAETGSVDDQGASVARIRTAARRMRALIRELLDVAHLDATRELELQRSRTDLVPLTTQLVDEFRQIWPDRTIELAASVPTLVGGFDRYRVERVVANLLSNALKFSLPGGVVRVALATAAPSWAVIEVADSGLGIPDSFRPHLFHAFRRGPNVVGRVHGDGLGLASAHDAVTRHGGTLTVQSTEGEGATFTVRLPLDPG